MTTATAPATLEMERELKHPPEKVWRALTEGPLLAQWLLPNDFQPVVGHKFTFRGEPKPGWDGVIPSEVLAVEPITRLVYRWYQWDVAITLTPTPAGTLLKLAQASFKPEDLPAYGGAKYGWEQVFFPQLDQLLAQI